MLLTELNGEIKRSLHCTFDLWNDWTKQISNNLTKSKGGKQFFWNVATHILIYTASYPRTKKSLMAQAVGRRPRWPGFDPRPVHARFVVDKVALEQDLLPVFRLSPVTIILPVLHVQPFSCYRHYIILAADLSSDFAPFSVCLSLSLLALVRTLQTSHVNLLLTGISTLTYVNLCMDVHTHMISVTGNQTARHSVQNRVNTTEQCCTVGMAAATQHSGNTAVNMQCWFYGVVRTLQGLKL
jgi:hypothetical protein